MRQSIRNGCIPGKFSRKFNRIGVKLLAGMYLAGIYAGAERGDLNPFCIKTGNSRFPSKISAMRQAVHSTVCSSGSGW
jgi:hypothetical protein